MESIRAVLFDMDGVIVDSMPAHFETWRSVLNDCGISIRIEDIYRREGMTGISSVKDIFQEKKAPIPHDDEIRKIMSRKQSLFEKRKISLFPEITAILHFLKDDGMKIALVTGSNGRSVEHVLKEDVSGLFNAVITADDVEKGKPDPEPYVAALDALGEPSSGSLVIENAPMGIESASSAGIRCIALETTLGREWLSHADLVLPDHTSLLEYFHNCMRN